MKPYIQKECCTAIQKECCTAARHAAVNFAFESALRQRDSGALTGALAEMLFEFILFIAPFVGIGRRF
ncbi:MAG: hypothetical protein ACI9MU_001060, partial [Alphaproteobacteria bacterium]